MVFKKRTLRSPDKTPGPRPLAAPREGARHARRSPAGSGPSRPRPAAPHSPSCFCSPLECRLPGARPTQPPAQGRRPLGARSPALSQDPGPARLRPARGHAKAGDTPVPGLNTGPGGCRLRQLGGGVGTTGPPPLPQAQPGGRRAGAEGPDTGTGRRVGALGAPLPLGNAPAERAAPRSGGTGEGSPPPRSPGPGPPPAAAHSEPLAPAAPGATPAPAAACARAASPLGPAGRRQPAGVLPTGAQTRGLSRPGGRLRLPDAAPPGPRRGAGASSSRTTRPPGPPRPGRPRRPARGPLARSAPRRPRLRRARRRRALPARAAC